MPVELVTIPNVPLVRTGHFDAMSGPVDFTLEHLEAAVLAFENDPAILAPRIHLGHEDPRFAAATRDQDGEPALGWFDNLRVDGNTLYGDAHMPAWLEEMADWAFPSRSVEGMFGLATATGNTHIFALTGVALLGVSLPAVETLDDLRELGERAGAVSVAASAPTVARMPRTVLAGVGMPDLSRAWYAAEESGELEGLPDTYDVWSWYVTEIRVDDDGSLFALVIDDATGDLWRFDATVSGNTVTFAKPKQVVVQFVAAQSSGHPSRPALARFTSRRESRGTQAASAEPNQEAIRPMTDEQRRALALALGLPEDTAEDALHTAAAERAAQDPADVEPDPTTEPDPAPVAEDDRELVAATAGATVQVSREVWEQTQRDAQAGAAARSAQITAERDQVVDRAVREGRIMASERQQWRDDLEASPDLVASQLGRLAAGKFPNDGREIGGVDASQADNFEAMRKQARIAAGGEG